MSTHNVCFYGELENTGLEIDYEIFSVVILSHLLIQEGQNFVSLRKNVHKYCMVNPLED